jgi:tubulin polyglutamylase TTLL1
MTSQNGIIKAYWFEEGYIRTSSSIFNLKNLNNKMVHLTNDAI